MGFLFELASKLPPAKDIREKMREKLEERIGSGSVLVVGAGSGFEIENIKQRNRVTVLDISIKELGRISGVKKVVGNVELLLFKNECFDYVISFQSFHLFGNPKKAIKEMRRVLKMGGELVIVTHKKQFGSTIAEFLFKLVTGKNIKYYSEKDMQELLGRFSKVDIEEYPNTLSAKLIDYEFLFVGATK